MPQPVRLLLILLVALSLVLIPSTSWATYRWTFGDERYWAVDEDHVCRDGAPILAFNQSSTEPDGGLEPSGITVVARLYADQEFTPPNESGFSDYPFAVYGPLLSAPYSFTMTYHSEPWLPSFTNQPGNIYMYNSGHLYWYQPLEPGTRIIVQSSFSSTMLDVEVDDCYLDSYNPLPVSIASSSTIDSSHLNSGYGMPSAAGSFFRLDSLPAYGEILLNGSALGIGDHFTQADIDGGRLRYAHDGSETSADSFAFHVEGTIRVSVDSAGNEGDSASFSPSLAGDARQIVFASDATDLIGDDTNELRDVFAHDLVLGQTTRVSVNGNGTETDDLSGAPQISAAFSYPIVFESRATTLPTGGCLIYNDADGVEDVLLRSFTLQRLSVSSVAYGKCYQANQNSYAPSIAAYGSTVAFVSDATNLLLGVDNDENVIGREDDNGVQDVYVRNAADIVSLASVPNGESGVAPTVLGNGRSYAPSISADGSLVAFQSNADNLVASDGNGVSDIFVHSLGETERVSVHTNGTETNAGATAPAISGNGRFVVFESAATNLVTPASNGHRHLFVHDTGSSNQTSQVSLATGGAQGNANSRFAAISFNGRFIAFLSDADNLVENDTNEQADIFVRDRDTDGDGIFDEPGSVRTIRVSVAADGSESNGAVQGTPTISSDGYVVAFAADADNLVANDNNDSRDIFVHYTGVSNIFQLQIVEPSLRLPTLSK